MITKINIFVEDSKQTPELLEGMDNILNEYCQSFEYDYSPLKTWTWTNCETIAYDCVEYALIQLSEKCKDTLIAIRCNDGSDIWSAWFLNSKSDFKRAEITFGEVDTKMIKNYDGEVV